MIIVKLLSKLPKSNLDDWTSKKESQVVGRYKILRWLAGRNRGKLGLIGRWDQWTFKQRNVWVKTVNGTLDATPLKGVALKFVPMAFA